MTTVPTIRPAIVGTPRPGAPGPATAGGIPTIDPIRLGKKYKWLLLATAAAGLFLGIVGHYALLWIYPVWAPYAVYQCFPIETAVGSMGPPTGFKEEHEKFMATQVQIMLSEHVVDRTVSDPNLIREAPKWSRQFMRNGVLDTARAAKELKKRVNAGIMGETSLIRLSFWWTDKDDATAIVRILGRTYLAGRQQEAQSDYSDRKSLISRSIVEITDSITKAQGRRTRLLQDQNVDSLDQQFNITQRNIADMNEKLVLTRADKEQLLSRRDQMEAELGSRAGPMIPDDIRKRAEEDPTIMRIKDEMHSLQATLTAARKRLGPDHRDIVRLETELEGLQQSLTVEREKVLRQNFDAMLDSIRSSVSGLAATEADLVQKIEAAKIRAVELSQTLAQVKDIGNEIDRMTDSRSKFADDLKQIEILTTTPKQGRVLVMQDAQAPRSVSFPKLTVMIPLGCFLALGLVVGVILLVEVVDQRVKGASDIGLIPRTRVLGVVPHASEDPAAPPRVETVFRDQPRGVLAEHFRQARGTILKRMQQGGHRSLLVMSGLPGSGATTVVCNMAEAMASAEQRVLVIDANFRRPGLHRVLGMPEAPGLAEVLAGEKTLDQAVQKTDNPRLSVLSAGAPDKRRVERLGTEAMSDVLRAASAYDIVIVDVAPASIAGDSLAVANRCDASMLVVRAFGEKRGMVARLRNDLGEVKAEFLGALLNAVRSSAGGYLKGNILATHQYQNDQQA